MAARIKTRRTTSRKPAAGKTATPTLTDQPQYKLDDKLQSEEFCRGVAQAKDLMVYLQSKACPRDDIAASQKIGQAIYAETRYKARERDAEFAKGFAYGLGNWLAQARHGHTFASMWMPFASPPLAHRDADGVEREHPGKDQLLFDVKGDAVAVGVEHSAYGFGPDICETYPIERVLKYGKAITRKEFDTLRKGPA